jgi:AraC-like DNA-binding protein
MRFERPRGQLAGFRAQVPDADLPAIIEFGQQWTTDSWQIGWHTNPGWEIYYQAEGSSRWQGGGHAVDLPAGGFYLAAPGTRHRLVRFLTARQQFFYAIVDAHAVLRTRTQLWHCWPEVDWVTGNAAHGLAYPFRQLAREISTRLPYRTEALRTHLLALLLETTRLLEREPQPASSLLEVHPAVARARETLESNPEYLWTLEELARLVNLSPNYLCQRFSREYGQPPHRFLMGLRLERARDLLRDSDLSITEIAHALSFSSSQHLAQVYRATYGRSPSSQRREMRSKRYAREQHEVAQSRSSLKSQF